jgi:putative transposase
MLKAYKYRIYPDAEQMQFFAKCFGCVRFVYNRMLSDRIEHYNLTGKSLNNTPAQYKSEFTWLKEVDSLALANAQMNLNTAYRNFFRDKSNGFPKFKSKKNNNFSYTTNNQKGTVYVENGYIKLPKLKSPVKIRQHRSFEGVIKSCTISKAPSGKYHISILVETEIQKLPASDMRVGIDVGIKDFAVLSNGEAYKNPKHLRKSEKRLAKLQRDLSRKQIGSSNRNKARIKVAKLHEKIANQRMDFLHKKSTEIIRENQAIVIEDLKVKNLMKNHNLAKSIAEVSWSRFREMLDYKSRWYGRELIIAPPDYPSSQLCSDCGNRSSQTKDLACRVYICPECGLEIDRDYNASLNLLKLTM